MFSPDGKLLYFLGNEILIFETENFTQVDQWDLSNLEEGLGQVSVSFGGFARPRHRQRRTGLPHDDDDRRGSGAAPADDGRRADQPDARKISSSTRSARPAASTSRSRPTGKRLRPGIERSAATSSGRFDLEQRRVVSRAEFDGRPRMSLKTSSNGRLLYIYNAGDTIDIYDGASYKLPAHDRAPRRRDDAVLRRAESGQADENEDLRIVRASSFRHVKSNRS